MHNTDDNTHRTANRRKFLKAIGVAGVVGVAGCSGDDGDETETPTDTTDTTGTSGGGDQTATVTDTPTPTETATQSVPEFSDEQLLTLEGPGAIEPGGTATLSGEIFNSYVFPLERAEVTLEAPGDGWEVTSTGETVFEDVSTQMGVQTGWEVTAPQNVDDGGYTITGTTIYESASDQVEFDISYSINVFTPGEVPGEGLEAYLTFDDDTATNQVTGTEATTMGEPTVGADGVVDTAWEFTDNGTRDSVADAVVTESLPLNGAGATVGAWANITGHEEYGRVYQVGGSTDGTPMAAGWDVEFDGATDTVWLVNWNGDSSRASGTAITLETDTWYFVVTVVDGDDARIHVFDGSGELDGSPTTGSGGRSQSDGEPLILMAADGSDTVGRMDEVRAYSRALSEQEVLELYGGSGSPE